MSAQPSQVALPPSLRRQLEAIAREGRAKDENPILTAGRMARLIVSRIPSLSLNNAQALAIRIYQRVTGVDPRGGRGPSPLERALEAPGNIFGAVAPLVLRVSVGALGLVLIVVGLIMISGEATLGAAASRLGRELRKGIAR